MTKAKQTNEQTKTDNGNRPTDDPDIGVIRNRF